jgi:hypothetical protein
LPQLLAAERGVRNVQALPPLDEGQIARWARAHRDRTGSLPTEDSGPVAEAPGETWRNIDQALRDAGRPVRQVPESAGGHAGSREGRQEIRQVVRSGAR